MATTISGINQALVDEKIIAALRYSLPMMGMFSNVIDAGEVITSDVVYVPVATDPAVATKTAGTFLTSGGTLAGTTVTMSSFRGAAWDASEGSMRPNLFPNFWADKAAGAVYSTVKDVIDTALALVTASNFGNTASDKLVVPAADFGQLDAALLWGLAEDKIKNQPKTFLMNTSYAAQLFGSSNIALIYANLGNDMLASGKLPTFLGLNQVHYGALPANSENLGGVVLGKGAIAIAAGIPGQLMGSGDGNISERRVISDPESGFSVLYTQKADAGGTVSGEVSLIFGVAKCQDAAVRLVSA